MKKNLTYHENTTILTADFDLHEKVNALMAEGLTAFESVETVNNTMKQLAINTVVTADSIKWNNIVYGVIYETLDFADGEISDETVFKALKVSDMFILKANKNSTKSVLPTKLLTLVRAFGVNVTSSKYTDLADETLPKLMSYAKYDVKYDCFTCETKSSVNQLEKQFDVFLKFFFGNDTEIKARKTYVKHLREQFVKAITDGYRNGNEIALLQLVINHSYDCAIGKEYTVKSGLDAHKKPKEKNA